MNIDDNKFTKLCEDVAVMKERIDVVVTNTTDIDKRVKALEKKWWTIHGVWLAVSGAIIFFKDKIL